VPDMLGRFVKTGHKYIKYQRLFSEFIPSKAGFKHKVQQQPLGAATSYLQYTISRCAKNSNILGYRRWPNVTRGKQNICQ